MRCCRRKENESGSDPGSRGLVPGIPGSRSGQGDCHSNSRLTNSFPTYLQRQTRAPLQFLSWTVKRRQANGQSFLQLVPRCSTTMQHHVGQEGRGKKHCSVVPPDISQKGQFVFVLFKHFYYVSLLEQESEIHPPTARTTSPIHSPLRPQQVLGPRTAMPLEGSPTPACPRTPAPLSDQPPRSHSAAAVQHR